MIPPPPPSSLFWRLEPARIMPLYQTSREFTQLYNIFAIVDSCTVPIVYGILSSKSVNIYLALFQSLLNRLPNLNPVRCMFDFGSSALLAIHQVYPIFRRTCCNFHLGQNICRKIRTLLTLRQYYMYDENIRLQLRTIQALAFVSTHLVYSYFLFTMAEINRLTDSPESNGSKK